MIEPTHSLAAETTAGRQGGDDQEAELRRQLEISERDRAARLEVILQQGRETERLETELRLWMAEVEDLSVRFYRVDRECEERGHRLTDLEAQFASCHADRLARLEVILQQGKVADQLTGERNQLEFRLADLEKHLAASEADRAARLANILEQGEVVGQLRAERDQLQFRLADIEKHLAASEEDRAARLANILEQGEVVGQLRAERNQLQFRLADLEKHLAASEEDRAVRLANILEQGEVVGRLTAERSRLQIEITELGRQIAVTEANCAAELEEHRAEIGRLNCQNEHLKRQMIEMRKPWVKIRAGVEAARQRVRAAFEEPLEGRPAESTAIYQPQFDSLRALAVLAVTSDHFAAAIPNFPVPDSVHLGPVAVRLFLILSGYFITDSLRRARGRLDGSRVAGRQALRRFYLRRFSRIVPAYALFLLIGCTLNLGAMRECVAWIATFTVNILVAWTGEWPPVFSHLWSICVQEQFYLVWPVLLLFLPRRWILPTVAGAALAGLMFRAGCVIFSAPLVARWVLPFGSLDALAGGAALACAGSLAGASVIRDWWAKMAAGAAAALALILAGVLRNGDQTRLVSVLVEPLEVAALVWVVAQTRSGWGGPLRRLLSWRGLLYAGRISYGIYVYHILVAVCFDQWTPDWCRWMIDIPVLRLLTLTAATVAVAATSWRWLERPVIGWCHQFGSANPGPTPATA